jgi:serine/threonine protein kinase
VLPSTTVPRGVFTLHTDASGTAPPDAFGPFRVLHQIGAGVLGPVFRAYQPDPGRLVAVKQFRLDLPPETAHRFVAALERLIAADLTHLGIAAPLAAGLVDNSPYLALDFVAAESFDVVIRDYGPAPVTDALRIATQLGGALDFAAAVNVFHGALHPRDVLVSTDDTRVTGLGIVQALEEVGSVPPVRRPYTAPERVAGAPWDRRADTFSLAALVFEMLFGRRIAGFGEEAADAIAPLEGADLAMLRKVFAKALAEDPNDRFETALAFAEALHAVVSEPVLPEKPARKSRSRERLDTTSGSRLALPLEPDHDLPLVLASEVEAPTREHHEVIAGESGDLEPPTRESESDATSDRTHARDETPGYLSEPEAPAREPHFGDLDLRAAEEARYSLADSESAMPDQAETSDLEVLPPPAVREHVSTTDDRSSLVERAPATGAFGLRAHDERFRPEPGPEPHSLASAALEQSRSAVWPIVLALLVGLSVGFAGGYTLFVARERANAGTLAVSDADDSLASSTAAERPEDRDSASTPVPRQGMEAARGSSSAPETRAAPATAPAPIPVTPPDAPRARTVTPSDRPAADAGRLLVRTSPAGARVTLDGRDAGVTPLTLNRVPRGTHVLRFALQGYVTAERRVRIGSTQPAQQIAVDLVATRAARGAAALPGSPDRGSGSLMVDSRPAGARVILDGRLVGTTPMLLDPVVAGEHTVRLELEGFNSWSSSARVAGGERARVSGSLEQR